jgi:hypothetical protein
LHDFNAIIGYSPYEVKVFRFEAGIRGKFSVRMAGSFPLPVGSDACGNLWTVLYIKIYTVTAVQPGGRRPRAMIALQYKDLVRTKMHCPILDGKAHKEKSREDSWGRNPPRMS